MDFRFSIFKNRSSFVFRFSMFGLFVFLCSTKKFAKHVYYGFHNFNAKTQTGSTLKYKTLSDHIKNIRNVQFDLYCHPNGPAWFSSHTRSSWLPLFFA